MHVPVLVQEVLSCFSSRNLRVFIDATVGAGGHACALLQTHPEIERFYGIDQDEEALKIAAGTLAPFQEKVVLIKSNFSALSEVLPGTKADGILADLGVSSMQLDIPEKGFSFSKNGPLDMRMDTARSLTAKEVVNHYSERELGRIFRDLAEEPRWRKAAKIVVEQRKKKPITTTFELVDALKYVLAPLKRKGKTLHPATLVFQGLRLFVNDELGVIEKFIPQAINALAPQGALAMIAFHSLEDRIVKHRFREQKETTKTLHILTKKPLIAHDAEIKSNPRSRSAKMRIIENGGYE